MLRGAARRPREGRALRVRNLATAGTALSLTLGAFGCSAPSPDSEAPEAEREGQLATPDPAFQTALWPGEGTPVLTASDTILVLRSFPSDTSRASGRVTPAPGDEIPFAETVYRTARPGALLVLLDHVLAGRSFGRVHAIARDAYYAADAPRREWALVAGDTVVLLQYRAEGSCFVRVGEAVVEADSCPTASPDAVRLLSEPVTEWWVRVDAPDGGSGWVRVGDGVRETGRRF